MPCAPALWMPPWSTPSWRSWRAVRVIVSSSTLPSWGSIFLRHRSSRRARNIKRHENTVRKFIRAFVEGVHFGKTQRAQTIKIMQKYLRSSDATMFDELYEMYIVRNIPRIPRPSPESLKTVLDQMAETDARVANLKPEQFIDARFFQELDKEGFIQKLWK